MSREQVLVVEDDEDLGESLRELLEYSGYEIVVRPNGREALRYLDECVHPPSLILLDLMMPVLDGWGFRDEQLRSVHRSIPVAVLTAAGNNIRPIAADAFLKKPVDIPLLLATVKQFCS
jgi:CheY-like chemotaxis protein